MRQPIERYFQIGLVAAMAFPECYGGTAAPDVVDCVQALAVDDYFGAVELNPIDDEVKRLKVASMLRQSHMKVCYSAHARLLRDGLNPNDLDEQGRRAAEQALLAGVDEAAELGAGGIAFLAGRWQEEKRQEALAQLKKTTLAVCGYAKTKGLMVELEVFDFDIDKKALIGPAALAAQFAAEVRESCDNFGLMVDLSHLPMCYEESAYVLRLLRPCITHFHVGNTVISSPDASAYGDEHPRFGYPQSENDRPQLLAFLRTMKQEGFFCKETPYTLSFEVKPRPEEDVFAVLANTKRVMNHAWALLED